MSRYKKIIAVLAVNQLSLETLYEKCFHMLQPNNSLTVLSTNVGIGSEVTDIAVITNAKIAVKMLMKDLIFMPQLSIVDSDFTHTVPAKVTGAMELMPKAMSEIICNNQIQWSDATICIRSDEGEMNTLTLLWGIVKIVRTENK